MSFLRTLLIAMLLVAVLPWGAYLRGAPDAAPVSLDLAMAEAHPSDAHAAIAGGQTAQKPAIKCRKGLLGSPCTPEPRALPASTGIERPLTAGPFVGDGAHALPEGILERPTLPPPRHV